MARSKGVARLALFGLCSLAWLSGCSAVVGSMLSGKDSDAGMSPDQGVVSCGSPAECNDGNPCTDDACIDSSCVRQPAFEGTPCGAGKACRLGVCAPCPGGVCPDPCASVACPPEEFCFGGLCRQCDAVRLCPDGFACSPDGRCVNPCDSVACGTDEICVAGVCQPCGPGTGCLPSHCTENAQCDDGSDCTTDFCDLNAPDGLCIHSPNDLDGDGYVALSCGGNDCDDFNSSINPGMPEVCNGIDDDCDTGVDNVFTPVRWYVDADYDGYGDPNSFTDITGCDTLPPTGSVPIEGDCDDADLRVHVYPMGDAPYFDTPRSDGTYDFDCDGVSTPEFGLVACAAGLPSVACTLGPCGGGLGILDPATPCGAIVSLYGCPGCAGSDGFCTPVAGFNTALKCH
jgi:hypothetical protein